MATPQFGLSQISNPTPASINLGVRIATVFIGIFLAWMNTNDLIGHNTSETINSIGGLLLALINGIAPLFGIPVNTPTVPTEDVTAVKNEGK